MLHLVIGTALLLALAALSAVAAYRWARSDAWNREYDLGGMGLTIELAYLVLAFLAVSSISLIMNRSFARLFLEDGWRSPLFLGAGGVIVGGVLVYMLVFAPRILARRQEVPDKRIGRECRVPYLLYTPFSLVSWAGLVLPLLAVITLAIQLDGTEVSTVRGVLQGQGHDLIASATAEAAVPGDRIAERAVLYSLAYRDAVDHLQRLVSRYLWIVGVFMVFMIVILNTRITSIFTETAQDSFKWLMWMLLLVAIGLCIFGVVRYQDMRHLAMAVQERVMTIARAQGQLELLAASQAKLLDLRNEGPAHFLRTALKGGGLWLMFFSYGAQIVLARITGRSVVQVIFPRPVARFLDAFMLSGEDGKAS